MVTTPTQKPKPARSHLAMLGVGLALVLVAAAAGIAFFGTPGGAGQSASIGGPFTLVDSAGKTVTDAAFRGKYMLVYFGYTYCPDVCPTTLNDVAQALDKIGPEADKLRPLFISVDPARDTPSVMGQYTAAFSPRIVGLTGSAEQIADVAKEYRVYYAKHQTGPGPSDYTMDHSSILYVMDPSGHFIGIIRADEPADQMAADLKNYLS